MRRFAGLLLALTLLAAASAAARADVAVAAAAAPAPWQTVDDARLLGAAHDDGSLMYRRSYDSQGYAPFREIDRASVGRLQLAYSYKTGMPQGHEAAPVVNGRYLYLTTPMDHVVALDATTGRQLWTYVHPVVPRALRTVCCDVVNRGVAIYGDLVYLATIDNHVVALDGRTGAVAWDRTLAPPGLGYAMTSAPLVVGGKLVVGISGGEYGARGFITALDARTGADQWKTYTVPAAGEPGADTWPAGTQRGGGPWLTGSYDPATDTLFWGVGNPGPWRADVRRGANLYSNSLLALDPRSGKLKWYFQFTPNDEWDYDGVNETVLTDITWHGKRRQALYHADRNGQFVVLDRRTGKLIYAVPFVKTNAVLGYGPDGAAVIDPASRLHDGPPSVVCPSSIGGKNWWPSAYDPALHLAFLPVSHMCMTMTRAELEDRPGVAYLGVDEKLVPEPGAAGFGEVLALDVQTGAKVWSHASALPWNDGMLATAGGLVFSGSADRTFMAFDARSGNVLWKYATSSGMIGPPVSYRVAGKQYVAVLAGWGGGVALFGGPAADAAKSIPRGGELYVFALP